jgi:hypothetical protein
MKDLAIASILERDRAFRQGSLVLSIGIGVDTVLTVEMTGIGIGTISVA